MMRSSRCRDVVIVGAGLAGLMCAHQLVCMGREVTIIHHDAIDHTSSYYAQGGIAAAWHSSDSIQRHIDDTIFAGDGLCDPEVVAFFCRYAPDFIQTLLTIGVPFDRASDGNYQLAMEGAHSNPRIFHSKDHTGLSIVQSLRAKLEAHPRVDWINATMDGLLTTDNRVVGVSVDGTTMASSVTVMATGGFSSLFSQSTNPKNNVGHGVAIAYMAGAQLGDLEFIQFHPTVCCVASHPPLLISEALRGEGAYLMNAAGEAFMTRYHPLGDLAPRDVVARAMMNEAPVQLNVSRLMPTIHTRFPTIIQALKDRGICVERDPILVQPLAHYTLGGIVASPSGQTTCPGLYAIGECAVTGVHGANRLASNSLLESGFMGYYCATQLPTIGSPTIHADHAMGYSPLTPASLSDLRRHCDTSLGASRTVASLRHAIQSLKASSYYEHPLCQLVEATLASAMHRTESRGSHYRSDYPNALPTARHSIVCRREAVRYTPNNQFMVE